MLQLRHPEWEIHFDAAIRKNGIHQGRVERVEFHDVVLVLLGAGRREELLPAGGGELLLVVVAFGGRLGGRVSFVSLTVENREA